MNHLIFYNHFQNEIKMKIFFCFTLTLSMLTWFACQNTATKTPPTASEMATPSTTPAAAPSVVAQAKSPTEWLVINEKGDNLLFGKKVDMKNLRSVLQDSLSRMAVLPTEIPVKYNGEILMGTRGEVKTQVQEALDGAKIHHVLMSDKGEDMVKNFYAWYVDKLNANQGYSLVKNKGDAESLLTNDLYKFLLKDSKKEDGIGVDYFLQAQDFGKDWGTVTILNTKTDGSKVTCTAQLGTGKDKTVMIAPQKVVVTVVDKKAGWRIEKVENVKK